MKKLLILLFFIPLVSGASEYAEISIQMMNRPPEITSMALSYEDSYVYCDVSVSEDALVEYSWKLNGNNLIDTQDHIQARRKDKVECVAVATDTEGLRSRPLAKNATFSPLTGMAVGSSGNATAAGILLLLIANLFLIRKLISPRRGYASS